MFPAKAPLSDNVDFTELAKHRVAGGHIKNAVLKAARNAANQNMPDDKKKITQKILKDAIASEMASSVAFKTAKKDETFFGTAMSTGVRRSIARDIKNIRAIDKIRGRGVSRIR